MALWALSYAHAAPFAGCGASARPAAQPRDVPDGRRFRHCAYGLRTAPARRPAILCRAILPPDLRPIELGSKPEHPPGRPVGATEQQALRRPDPSLAHDAVPPDALEPCACRGRRSGSADAGAWLAYSEIIQTIDDGQWTMRVDKAIVYRPLLAISIRLPTPHRPFAADHPA